MQKIPSLFEKKLGHISSMLKDISGGYIDSRFQEKSVGEAYFACVILQSLVDHKSIFAFVSKIHRKDLKDSLVTHNIKYLKVLEKQESEIQDKNESEILNELGASNLSTSEIFKQNIEIIKKELNTQSKIEGDLSSKDFDTICSILSKILDRIKDIFSEQNHNEKEVDNIIAISIAMFFSALTISEQESLIEDINNVREIWHLEQGREYSKDDKIVLFLKNFREKIDPSEYQKSEDVFKAIFNYLVIENQILESCSDAGLLSLYSRIRNNSRIIKVYPTLLFNIHQESKLRYQCNRASTEAYELLGRFQKFDTSISNFESMENNIVERYLTTKDLFSSLIDDMDKNVDIMVFLKLSNDRNLITILDKLDNYLKSIADARSLANLSRIRDIFSRSVDVDLQKKFDGIDYFQIYALKQRYSEFFSNFVEVINENGNYLDYLKYLLNKRLANNYYVNNASNSIDKLRKMNNDRDEVEKLFAKVDLLGIFMRSSGNKIKSLNFRDEIKQIDNYSPKQFVALLIQSIVQACTAFQLDAAYNNVIKDDLNTVEKFLKKEIIKQIHFRSSISKMIMSILSGNKQEYKKIKELSKKASSSK